MTVADRSRQTSRARASRRAARREREREIVRVTRELFDERGAQDARIDRIARAVGVNKALIYRSFASKDELFALTVTDYLRELGGRLAEVDSGGDPAAALREACERYATFCLEYPAFLDGALSLARQPAEELRASVSDAVWLRLGRATASCLGVFSAILAAGAEGGAFADADPDFTANRLYAQVLGTMHLARAGVGVRAAAPGIPETFELDPERVREACVRDALAIAEAR